MSEVAAESEMSPSERLFRYEVEHGADFVAGVVAGQWALHSIEWPHAVIVVAVWRGPVRREIALRFNLVGYRSQLPTSVPWDIERDAMLDGGQWPRGGAALNQAFNPSWNTALYIPYDRVALPGHEPWIKNRPAYVWGPNSDITDYLKLVRRLLDDDDFLAADQAA